MAGSQDTIVFTNPCTPNPSHLPIEADEHAGDFARLTPANRPAFNAFDGMVERMMSDPERTHHTRKFVHYEEAKCDPFSEPEGSDTETTSIEINPLRWIGCYRLNMQIQPNSRMVGWVVGSGRKDLDTTAVDILLTPFGKPYRVAGRHARLVHNLMTGVLLVKAGRGLSEELYKEQLSSLRNETCLSGFKPPPSLEPTPSDNHYDLKDYTVQAVFAQGSTSTVAAGIRKADGCAVAVKRMKRDRKSFAAVRHEVRVLKSLGQHPRICSLVGDLYSGGNQDEAGPNQVDEVFLIYSPLAYERFHDLIASDITDHARAVYFKQCCEGVEFLHERGLIHRDIKPGNIAVVSHEPPRALIIDLGVATWDESSSDHRVGTIRYLAPEVISLKMGTTKAPYDRMVDVWGLGLSAFELFHRVSTSWAQVDKSRFDALKQKMASEIWSADVAPVTSLVARMLQWDPQDRVSMARAVSDLSAVDAGSVQEGKDKGKRLWSP